MKYLLISCFLGLYGETCVDVRSFPTEKICREIAVDQKALHPQETFVCEPIPKGWWD